MFKNFPWFIVKEFLCSVTFAFILFLIAFGVFVSSAHAQTVYPTCTGGNNAGSGSGCFSQQSLSGYAAQCQAPNVFSFYPTGSSCNPTTYTHGSFVCHVNAQCSCPSGYSLSGSVCVVTPPPECLPPNQIFNGECITPVDEPQDCGSTSIDVTAYQLTSGQYACMPGANYPCGEGMTPGTVLGTAGTINICDQPNGDSSSSSGNNSSSNNSDGGDDGDGSGSSSGNETSNSSSSLPGCPVPANSTCPNKYEVNGQWYCASGGDFCSGGGGSSASSSTGGGSGSSAGAGQCDPTAKNYLECLNSKEINLPTEKGTFDGTGTDAEDRIGELEGELTDLVNQIKGEIQDVTGASVGGSGTLTDKCYQILKVQVCFGWARWSSLLSVIGTAIIAAAGVASFIIIMRQ